MAWREFQCHKCSYYFTRILTDMTASCPKCNEVCRAIISVPAPVQQGIFEEKSGNVDDS